MARVLTLDIETQRGVVELFDLWPKYIDIDRVRVPTRMLCFAAKFRDEDEVGFFSAWEDGDTKAYYDMIEAGWHLLNEAEVVVTWNGDKFDLQWFQGEFLRLKMGPPSPYRSLDLFKVARSKFGRSLMSLKLDWSARQILGDKKVEHGGADLWHDIRYGTAKEKLAAQKLMMDYNCHDTVLTEQLLERFLPWTGVNFSLYDEDNADRTVCPFCESPKIQKRGLFPTRTYQYQRYYCTACKGWSRGRRMYYTTELRPV